MTKSNIVSATNANRLYWLGRYEERVYATLHLLRKCYDKMIDGQPDDYASFWRKFNIENTYPSVEEFEFGMLYDEQNVSSVLSAQVRAMDNAMVLRSCIMSESLSYLEMSVAKLRQGKADRCTNIAELQQVTDWSLAFFGSVEQRIENSTVLCIIYAGRIVEYIDTMLRFHYPIERVQYAFEGLQVYLRGAADIVDTVVEKRIATMLASGKNETEDRHTMLKLINILIRV